MTFSDGLCFLVLDVGRFGVVLCYFFRKMRVMEQGDAWYKYGDLERMECKNTKLSFFFRCFVLFSLGVLRSRKSN